MGVLAPTQQVRTVATIHNHIIILLSIFYSYYYFMNKIITQEQIGAIIQEFYKLNAPVQNFEAVRKLLQELPDVPQKEGKEVEL